jgi:hypothetical protein
MSNEKPGSNAGLFDSNRPHDATFFSEANDFTLSLCAFPARRERAPLFEHPTLRFPPKRSC